MTALLDLGERAIQELKLLGLTSGLASCAVASCEVCHCELPARAAVAVQFSGGAVVPACSSCALELQAEPDFLELVQ